MVQTNCRVNASGSRIGKQGVCGTPVFQTRDNLARQHSNKEQHMADLDTLQVYVGCYTSGDALSGPGHGIVLGRFDPAGRRMSVEAAWAVPDASYTALAPDGRTLYAVSEGVEGRVSAFAVEASGRLRQLSTQPTGGAEPCHLMVHPSGRYLLTANYGSGSVAVHPILPDGGLGEPTGLVRHSGSGPDPDRQASAHAHMVSSDPAGETVLAVDLGADCVFGYRLDLASGQLIELSTSRMRPGSGPRHLAFHPTSPHAYLVNELTGTVSVYSYAPASGVLTELAEYDTAPAGGEVRNYPGGIVISPDGRYVYVSNRGDESIAAFAVTEGGARLEPAGRWSSGGSWPRHITLSSDGRFLFCANQRSDSVTVFAVDPTVGALTPVPAATLATPSPAHILLR
jgi:6-phosphogluconolactonase